MNSTPDCQRQRLIIIASGMSSADTNIAAPIKPAGVVRPLAFFAGMWVPKWTSTRKVKEGETTNDI